MSIVPRNFANHFDTFDQSQHLLLTLHRSLCFISWNNKALILWKCVFYSIFNVKMHKNLPILVRFFFLMHADMTGVTMQFDKIASNGGKDNLALLEPSFGEKVTDFLATPACTRCTHTGASTLFPCSQLTAWGQMCVSKTSGHRISKKSSVVEGQKWCR